MWLFALACAPPELVDDTGLELDADADADSDSDSDTDADVDEHPIVSFEVLCDGIDDEYVELVAHTSIDPTGLEALVLIGDPEHNDGEEHPFNPMRGTSATVSVVLQTGQRDPLLGFSTSHACNALGPPGYATAFIVRLYDGWRMVDCLGTGTAPEDVLNGRYGGANSDDFVDCRFE